MKYLWIYEEFVFLEGWRYQRPKEVTLIAETERAWKIKINCFYSKWIVKDSHNQLEKIEVRT